MQFFVKAKFPPVELNGCITVPERKARFDDRDKAFDFIAQALTDGSISVTIRPEGK